MYSIQKDARHLPKTLTLKLCTHKRNINKKQQLQRSVIYHQNSWVLERKFSAVTTSGYILGP